MAEQVYQSNLNGVFEDLITELNSKKTAKEKNDLITEALDKFEKIKDYTDQWYSVHRDAYTALARDKGAEILELNEQNEFLDKSNLDKVRALKTLNLKTSWLPYIVGAGALVSGTALAAYQSYNAESSKDAPAPQNSSNSVSSTSTTKTSPFFIPASSAAQTSRREAQFRSQHSDYFQHSGGRHLSDSE